MPEVCEDALADKIGAIMFSRRHLLTGISATAVAAMLPRSALAVSPSPDSHICCGYAAAGLRNQRI